MPDEHRASGIRHRDDYKRRTRLPVQKLALFGFVFFAAAGSLFFIIPFHKRLYANLGRCKLALFFQIMLCQLHREACHSALDAESRIIKMTGFPLSQE
jgi:hypothetical protein